MTQIEVKEETAARLRAIAAEMKLPLGEWLDRIAQVIPAPTVHEPRKETVHEPHKHEPQKEEELSPFELVKDLIGVVDSSVHDPSPPPRHTEFGRLLVEKFRKQGLKLP